MFDEKDLQQIISSQKYIINILLSQLFCIKIVKFFSPNKEFRGSYVFKMNHIHLY